MVEISRRKFLKGASLGALSAGALAACSPKVVTDGGTSASTLESSGSSTIKTSSDLAVSPVGTNYPWPANPPEITDSDVESEVEADVIVVGLGVGGVAATRSAAEAGVKVIAFEKSSQPNCRSSQYSYLNGPLCEQWGLPTFDIEELVQMEYEECGCMSKRAILSKWAYNCATTLHWWIEGADVYIPKTKDEAVPKGTACALSSMAGNPDVDWKADPQAEVPEIMSVSDHSYVLKTNMDKVIKKYGVVPYYAHFVEKLMKDGDRIVGLYARNSATGKYVKATASKGVILASGCFGSNRDMLAYFTPEVIRNQNGNPWPNLDAEGNKTNTGDGFKLGYWIGASIQAHIAPMVHAMGGPGGINMTQPESMGIMSIAPFMRLNKAGKRFMNENLDNTNTEYQIDLQRDNRAYMIWDNNWPSQVTDMFMTFPISAESLEQGVTKGTVLKADTLEKLLDLIGDIDKETALASINRYNDLCTNGKDEDFDKAVKYLHPLTNGPFYCQIMGSALCLVTMGGLESDEDAHVYSTERKVIPGLYAVGNIQGNRFAIKYPFKMGGKSHSMAMYYGYVAGQNAAKGV